jgi:hypothetical protein
MPLNFPERLLIADRDPNLAMPKKSSPKIYRTRERREALPIGARFCFVSLCNRVSPIPIRHVGPSMSPSN